MAGFSTRFSALPGVDDLDRIELLCAGEPCGVIENRPGQQGSLRIYHAVADAQGVIDPLGARRALELYGDYAGEARAAPGSHPNIDRLLELLVTGQRILVRVVPRERGLRDNVDG